MLLYHGSSKGDLKTLLPFVADHGKPYVYFSTDDVSAAFHAASVVQRPSYWFPYAYDAVGRAVYTELFPGAFSEAYAGKPGFLYVCEPDEKKLLRFPSNPHLRLSTEPVSVRRCERIENLHDWFLQREREDRLVIRRFQELTPSALSIWHGVVLEALQNSLVSPSAESSYAKFVQEKMPAVWERFLQENG